MNVNKIKYFLSKFQFNISFTCEKESALNEILLSIQKFTILNAEDSRSFDHQHEVNRNSDDSNISAYSTDFTNDTEHKTLFDFIDGTIADKDVEANNEFNQNDPIDPTISSSTVMMSTQITIEENESAMTWKIISIVCIVFAFILLIVSICLWRALPSDAPKRATAETSIEFSRSHSK